MKDKGEGQSVGEDIIFRLRAKMDDHAYRIIHEENRKILAFRLPGEKIDLLPSLELLAEYLTPESVEGVANMILISDREYQVADVSMIVPKLKTKKEDDERLFRELSSSLKEPLKPLVFTMENDILELYRIGIKVEGSHEKSDAALGLDLLKVELPKEGDIVYLIFDDGFRKMSRESFERLVDDSLSSLRQGPSLIKDSPANSLSKKGTFGEKKKEEPVSVPETEKKVKKPKKSGPKQVANEPKVIVRDFVRELSSMGYRKDSMFSRSDVHQIFLIGMKGPAVFFKYLTEPGQLDPFLRVLSHRKDALGVLVTDTWDPRLEAVSRIEGFIYLDRRRSRRAPEVIKGVLEEGGDN